MAVFRIEKTRDYTVMSNHHLRDRSLSLKAKGLLSLMLFLPEEPEQGNPAQLNTNRSSKEKSKKFYRVQKYQILSYSPVPRPMTVKRSLNELEIAGLIMRVRQGVGEPNRIYVLMPGKEDAALA